MEREESENLRRRFRELAAAMESVHDEWKEVAERDDFAGEKRLIEKEAELLAEIDQVVKAFQEHIGHRRPT